MWTCANCGEENSQFNRKCHKCGITPSGESNTVGQIPRMMTPELASSGFSKALKLCGWIDLIAGILGGMIFLSGSVGIAIAVAFQGVVIFVLLNVIAEIADTLRAILFNMRISS